MLEAVARTLVRPGLGGLLRRLGILPAPAAVTGFILLVDMTSHAPAAADLDALADRLLGCLGMLPVPAGVGAITHAHLSRRAFWPIGASLVGGTVVTLVVSRRTEAREEQPLAPTGDRNHRS